MSSQAETQWRRLVGDHVGQPSTIAGITIDVTDQKNLELELRRSNEDLDIFADVVSHDLQEPIRMVTTYARLIQRRYGSTLGRDGDNFIAYT